VIDMVMPKDVLMFNDESYYFAGGQFQEAKKIMYIFLRS